MAITVAEPERWGTAVADGASTFEAFYDSTNQRLLAQLYAFCGDRGEAQDCLQDAYVRAWQRWDQVSGYERPEAWVRIVAWRLAANRWHKARSAIKAWVRHGPGDYTAEPSPDSVALVTGLRLLPVAQREAVVLHHIADLSVEDIATELGVPTGTVKARLARGRAALAQHLSLESTDD